MLEPSRPSYYGSYPLFDQTFDVAVDAGAGLVYFLEESGVGVYDLARFVRLAEIAIPELSRDQGSLVLWREAGLAFRSGSRVYLVDATLPDDWDPATVGDQESVEDEYDFGVLIADLPDRQREVADLIYREGLSHEQAAERLGITRNAVDQALHNAHRKLAEKLSA